MVFVAVQPEKLGQRVALFAVQAACGRARLQSAVPAL